MTQRERRARKRTQLTAKRVTVADPSVLQLVAHVSSDTSPGYSVVTGEPDDDLDIINGTDGLVEPGTRIVTNAEVRQSTGDKRQTWIEAATKELHESFHGMGAVTVTTPQEKAKWGKHRYP